MWEQIKKALDGGYAEFTYIKKEDGSLRLARGTRNKRVLSQIKTFTFAGRKPSDKVVCYFDFDRNDWRCFLKKNATGLQEKLDENEIEI